MTHDATRDGPLPEWKFVGHCVDGRTFRLQGVNVWDHEWIPLYRDPPPPPTGDAFRDDLARREKALVTDPVWGQKLEFNVYEIAVGSRRFVFAAGEFSNMIWGFYVQKGMRERLKFLSRLTILFGRCFGKYLAR